MRGTQDAFGAMQTEQKSASRETRAHKVVRGVAGRVVAVHGSARFPTTIADGVFGVFEEGSGEQKTATAVLVHAGAPQHAIGVNPIVLAGVKQASLVGRLAFSVDGAQTALTRIVLAFERRWIDATGRIG